MITVEPEAVPSRDVLAAALRERVERRRQEQAAELQQARDAAVALIAAARADAAALVAAASAETAELLVGSLVGARAVVPTGWTTVRPAAIATPLSPAGWTVVASRPDAATPMPPAAEERRGFWTNVAYADVVLPLVAVLLVLVVLFAWVA